MSGHSKWSTIKRQKGAADAKRGQLFTKLSNAITIAVKQGGGITDPASNFKLRLTVEKARAANMPKENIERAIAKGAGAGGAEVSELLYEGFAPGGAALIIEALTDNKQRTVAEIKNILEKNGGSLGAPGSVSYLFKKKGQIVVRKNALTSDELLNKGLIAGVDDMEEEGNEVFFYVEAGELFEAKSLLEGEGLLVESAEQIYFPDVRVSPGDEMQSKVMSLIEKLNDLDDVQEVYSNLG